MMCRSTARSDVLGSGTGNYGHGSIMRGGGAAAGRPPAEPTVSRGGSEMAVSAVRRAMTSMDPEEVKKAGNEEYKMGHFMDALKLYERAISMCPGNAACHSNKAAALIGLGMLTEAARECEEAVRLDPTYCRAHQRLVSLYIRLGQPENATKHIFSTGQQLDHMELQKLQVLERHVNRCADARRIGDWKSALRESDAAIAAGADSSSLLLATRAEALLRLHRLEEADLALSKTLKLECSFTSSSQTTFFGMFSNAYLYIVQAQVEMALGRFESAVSAAEKAGQIDPRSMEVATVLANVRSVARARSRGNELFNSGKFTEACAAYGEGLNFDPSNPVLYCNRAASLSKLGQWEKSVQDCNEALRIQPNYTKALLRRAASNGKLERWAVAVRDYEVLRKELPGDKEVAEALFHAQVALKTSRGEEVSNLKFGGEVEKISGVEHFRAAISLPGVSVIHFMAVSNQQCLQVTPFVDGLCTRYPSVNFLKVDVDESPDVAKVESVRTVPTFKIYKNGTRVKEMICPSRQVLEYSVRHYGL
uniref:TPR repeat-containing thioredoxin TTL1 n=1 Tax=Anthurium amnicola TaxID=1678845 RepID=A0A1D1XRE2_9ARAE